MSKRQILIIVENESVPFDRRVWNEACSLYENGYEVTVLCPRANGYRRGYEVIHGIRIYRYPASVDATGVAGYVLEYLSALFWQYVYSAWIYYRHGFDVIQGCNPPDTICLVALPFKLLGVKYIFDHHDAAPELYRSKYHKRGLYYLAQRWLEKLTFRCSDVVIATNESYKNLAINRGNVNPPEVFVVRNGPDLRTFKAVTPSPALKHGKPHLVGYVGVMNVQDGLDMLLDVASYLKRLERRDIHFTCIGGGSELSRLRERVEREELDDTVDFTGRISEKLLVEILSTADVCVNPDTPCEMNDISTMVKIMEYMALGKPVVQFDLKEGRVSAEEASLYADKSNPVPDFAGKILWLLDNPQEARRMGEFGKRRVESALAWEHSVGNLLAAYERVFGKKLKGVLLKAQG